METGLGTTVSFLHPIESVMLQGGLGDPRIALRPVIAAAGDQPHPIAIPLNADAEAVLLDFVKPLRPGRDLGCISR